MVAILNKYLKVLFVLVVFPSLSCAESAYKNEEALTAYQISYNNFIEKRDALERKITECEKGREAINASLLEPFGLSLKELKTALFVLNQRAEIACEDGFREQTFYAAGIHRQVSKSYGKSSADAENYSEDLLLIASRKKLDYESAYLKINKKTRMALEGISQMQRPFLIFETIEQFE